MLSESMQRSLKNIQRKNRNRELLSGKRFSLKKNMITSILLFLSISLVVISISCKKEITDPVEQSGNEGNTNPNKDTNPGIELSQFFIIVCNKSNNQIEIYNPDDEIWDSSTVKWAWKPTIENNFSQQEVNGWGHPTDVKERRITSWGEVFTWQQPEGAWPQLLINQIIQRFGQKYSQPTIFRRLNCFLTEMWPLLLLLKGGSGFMPHHKECLA